MVSASDWRSDLELWLAPFLSRLGHPARRAMCPAYVAGLIGPGERKSVAPLAERQGMASHDALHHFIAVGPWDEAALEEELFRQADRLVGGPEAYLIVDGEPAGERAAEERHRLGGRCAAVCVGSRQERHLPDPCVANPVERGGAGARGLAAVPAGELDG